jgi:hypothetical protein
VADDNGTPPTGAVPPPGEQNAADVLRAAECSDGAEARTETRTGSTRLPSATIVVSAAGGG